MRSYNSVLEKLLPTSRCRALAILPLIGLLVATALVLAGCGGSGGGEETPSATPTPTPIPPQPALIDGVLVPPERMEELRQRLPLAIVLDNNIAARPQIGLDQAELVYEAIAEGGITRFLAVYWRNDVNAIEPVRSARVYFIDWTAELDGIFVHHGYAESPGTAADVLNRLAATGVRDLEGLFLGSAVGERDPNREAPHNVVSSTGLLWSTAASVGFVGPPGLVPWTFKEDTPARGSDPAFRAAPAIDLSFGGIAVGDHVVRWDYDPASNTYLRSMGGGPHLDGGSGQRINAKNVIVQVANFFSAGDGLHNLYENIGEGQAIVFLDGIAIEGVWRKPDFFSRTRFFDAAGAEIVFNRGTTWIEVLPPGSPLTY